MLRAVIIHTSSTNTNYIMSNENGYKLIENTKFKLGGELSKGDLSLLVVFKHVKVEKINKQKKNIYI